MSKILIQPYLFFGGLCDEALAFYVEALGAEVEMVMRYKDSPEPVPPGMLAEGFESKVMHASFRVGGNTIMASDGCAPEATKFEGFRISYATSDEAEAKRIFAALVVGGEVQMPLNKTFWAPLFGMVTDRFGLGWMVSMTP